MMLTAGGMAPTIDALKSFESAYLNQIGSEAMIWTGRAATGLYAVYRLAASLRPEIDRPEVIVPAIMCATAANTALLAGVLPRFVDVDPLTGLMDPAMIPERLTERTVAIVAIHLYGQTMALDSLRQLCDERGILLIEDHTQALGGVLPDGRPVGSAGDASVCSFNRTKIIDVGGGALTLRRAEWLEPLQAIFEAEPLPPTPAPERLAELSLSYRNMHHGLSALLRMGEIMPEEIAPLFLQVRPAYNPLYLRPAPEDGTALAAAWSGLDAALQRRRRRAMAYAEQLEGGPWHLLNGWQDSGVCWRYTLLLDHPRQQRAFSEAVRGDGFHVSNLYWPPHHFFRPQDTCPQADAFARRVVNLWVDEGISDDYPVPCAASLKKHARLLA